VWLPEKIRERKHQQSFDGDTNILELQQSSSSSKTPPEQQNIAGTTKPT
jgi:hypothetical protein